MSENKKLLELQKTHENLFSTDNAVVEKALGKIVATGTELSIRPLLELYITTDNDKIKTVIEKLLYSLKTPNSAVHLVEALRGDNIEEFKSFILSIFWNAGIPGNDHVLDLVEEAVQGDFKVAFEVLTIVENMDGSVDQLSLEAALVETTTYLSSESKEDKYPLVESLQEILESFQE